VADRYDTQILSAILTTLYIFGMSRIRLFVALAALAALVAIPTGSVAAKTTARPAANPTFTNPVRSGSDPYILSSGGYYYFTSTDGCDGGYVCVWKSATISGLGSAPKYDVFHIPGCPAPNCANVWAPEIHQIGGAFYIYYTANSGGSTDDHRMFVLQATSGDPTGSYAEANTGYAHGQLYESSGSWAIDPDVFTGADGALYATWSGSTNGAQDIYLAPMSDPLHISGARVLISTPNHPWETVGSPDVSTNSSVGYSPINEGPVGFVHGGRTYITYSASACWVRSYAVGLLTNSGGSLLSAGNWTKTGPLFKYHSGQIGTASFVPISSPDGTEDWFLVHANTNACDPGRVIDAQRLYWDPRTGAPLLGYPIGTGVAIPDPSGENGSTGTGNPYASGWGNAFGDAAEGDTTDGTATGAWNVTGLTGANLTSFGGTPWTQLFYATNPDYENYTVSAQVQWAATGTTSAYPKYGLYGSYDDRNNHVEVFIDRQYMVLATHAVVQGVEQPWQNANLPAGFDPTQFHTLSVTKSGAHYTFSLDGTQLQDRTFTGSSFPTLLNGQPGLVTEDTEANYRNVTVTGLDH
jgi:GH43 family beta-xylosidase